jgi:Tol biopolymer transport system component
MARRTSRIAVLALTLGLIGVATAGLCDGWPPPSAAAYPGHTSLIVFESSRTTGPGVNNPEGDGEIFTMKPDGSDVRQLTHNHADDFRPAWSADGMKIAFVSRRDGYWAIYKMSANGKHQTRLTGKGLDGADFPDWSPDGERIVFSKNENSHTAIYTMYADGSHLVQLTASADIDDYPAWSPDGQLIAFADSNGNLSTMTPQGTGLTQLTNNNGFSADADPAWSPDGTRIAYTRSAGDSSDEIWTMAADGSSQTQRSSFFNVEERRPTWSPDGALIAFEADFHLVGVYTEEIYTVTDNGVKTNITKNKVGDGDPDWRP